MYYNIIQIWVPTKLGIFFIHIMTNFIIVEYLSRINPPNNSNNIYT